MTRLLSNVCSAVRLHGPKSPGFLSGFATSRGRNVGSFWANSRPNRCTLCSGEVSASKLMKPHQSGNYRVIKGAKPRCASIAKQITIPPSTAARPAPPHALARRTPRSPRRNTPGTRRPPNPAPERPSGLPAPRNPVRRDRRAVSLPPPPSWCAASRAACALGLTPSERGVYARCTSRSAPLDRSPRSP